MPTLYLDSILAVIRHILTVVAGVLVSRGLINSDQTNQLIDVGIGVVTFLATIGWSLYLKWKAKRILLVTAAHAGITENQAVAKAAAPDVPSVLTPPTVVPVATPKPAILS